MLYFENGEITGTITTSDVIRMNREKQQQQSECEHIYGLVSNHPTKEGYKIAIAPLSDYSQEVKVEYNFCPNCGKRLIEE